RGESRSIRLPRAANHVDHRWAGRQHVVHGPERQDWPHLHSCGSKTGEEKLIARSSLSTSRDEFDSRRIDHALGRLQTEVTGRPVPGIPKGMTRGGTRPPETAGLASPRTAERQREVILHVDRSRQDRFYHNPTHVRESIVPTGVTVGQLLVV